MFESINLFTIFTTGLLAGGLSCMAVQGGLLASIMLQRTSVSSDKGKILPLTAFIFAKLIAYTVLGFFLGWFGSFISISIQTRVILQLAVVVFMVGTALNLLEVHPIFRYFVIQPPRFLAKLIWRGSKRDERLPMARQVFASASLGAFTVFIPCGTTQAMMLLAVASGNAFLGALILFVFVLGTSPLFFILGYMTMKVGSMLQKHFMRVAAAAIMLLAVFNLDTALALTGTRNTLSNSMYTAYCLVSYCEDLSSTVLNPVSEQVITITQTGYSPNYFSVKAGSTVTLHLTNKGATGCTQALTIPALNIQRIIQPNTSGDLVFKAPSKPGKISFMCSQGMYPGTIEVL